MSGANLRKRARAVKLPADTIVSVSLTNETKGYNFSEYDEELDRDDLTIGDVYRIMRAEYGRCTGRVYNDADGPPKAVGWHFVSRQRYEDTNEPYLRGAWVTLSRVVTPSRPAVVEYVEVTA